MSGTADTFFTACAMAQSGLLLPAFVSFSFVHLAWFIPDMHENMADPCFFSLQRLQAR
jgi:hypothetical protein